jgi:hypothetical protein
MSDEGACALIDALTGQRLAIQGQVKLLRTQASYDNSL